MIECKLLKPDPSSRITNDALIRTKFLIATTKVSFFDCSFIKRSMFFFTGITVKRAGMVISGIMPSSRSTTISAKAI